MNDPAAALTAAAADNSAVYTIGFYSPDEPDDKWRDVSLKVKRPEIRLNYRQGYISKAPSAQPRDWSQDQWRAGIYNPLGSSSLRLDARCHIGSGASAGMVFIAIRFELTDLLFRTVDNRQSAQIEIAYVEIKPNGTYNIQRRDATLNYTDRNGGSVQTERSWNLDPEAKTIRVILRDKLAGSYGTLDLPVKEIPVR
jgi:hypothetical protein